MATLQEQIEKIVKDLRAHIIALDDMHTGLSADEPVKGDIYFDGIEIEARLRLALTSIATASLEAVKVEKSTLVGWNGTITPDVEGYNLAVQEQQRRASEYLNSHGQL